LVAEREDGGEVAEREDGGEDGGGDLDRRGRGRTARCRILGREGGNNVGKEARAGPTCQHPWRTD
jgi:hypothetical protein